MGLKLILSKFINSLLIVLFSSVYCVMLEISSGFTVLSAQLSLTTEFTRQHLTTKQVMVD
jgi:hypothetical protein